MPAIAFRIRKAVDDDLNQLLTIEEQCFSSEKLSRRSFRSWLKAPHGELWVAEAASKDTLNTEECPQLLGYGLAWLHKGTRLARLYSLATLPQARGSGVAAALMSMLEERAADRGRLYMRLEVAKKNSGAIRLYQNSGYKVFGEYFNYYQDHDDALRMQKQIQHLQETAQQQATPWYAQTTEFTCGPAALMMAMASLDDRVKLERSLELDLWREATTIFMTSGHGGCHPVGLGLSAQVRGFHSEVFLNSQNTLFVDGVRSAHKKDIIALVHQQFMLRAAQQQLPIHYRDLKQHELERLLSNDQTQDLSARHAVLLLISTSRLDGKRAPHWVVVTGMDERCFYVHDPDVSQGEQLAIDCQYLPIARDDYDSMTSFGSERLRAAVVLSRA